MRGGGVIVKLDYIYFGVVSTFIRSKYRINGGRVY